MVQKVPAEDQARVVSVVRHGVQSALFGFFCVLDGVRAIEDGAEGRLELTYVKGDNRRVINTEENFLHDIYQALVYDEVFDDGAG